MERAEPPLQAEIMMSISMTLSLIWSLPLWTMKTSWSRTEVSCYHVSQRATCLRARDILISTDVSPLLNFFSSTCERFWPRRSQIASTRKGCEDPEKMHVCRMTTLLELLRVRDRRARRGRERERDAGGVRAIAGVVLCRGR